eukprot:TRINITY_DN1743_c1_g1_i2.p1 TRINITY_DN1743_c1_g1~~TRINITY_DN1743_c1_g1_i2.p1  ORF type:complete len:525 (+),score=75.27 TRINITY_DN1743_c1_g1_i2:105-1577(+)
MGSCTSQERCRDSQRPLPKPTEISPCSSSSCTDSSSRSSASSSTSSSSSSSSSSTGWILEAASPAVPRSHVPGAAPQQPRGRAASPPTPRPPGPPPPVERGKSRAGTLRPPPPTPPSSSSSGPRSRSTSSSGRPSPAPRFRRAHRRRRSASQSRRLSGRGGGRWHDNPLLPLPLSRSRSAAGGGGGARRDSGGHSPASWSTAAARNASPQPLRHSPRLCRSWGGGDSSTRCAGSKTVSPCLFTALADSAAGSLLLDLGDACADSCSTLSGSSEGDGRSSGSSTSCTTVSGSSRSWSLQPQSLGSPQDDGAMADGADVDSDAEDRWGPSPMRNPFAYDQLPSQHRRRSLGDAQRVRERGAERRPRGAAQAPPPCLSPVSPCECPAPQAPPRPHPPPRAVAARLLAAEVLQAHAEALLAARRVAILALAAEARSPPPAPRGQPPMPSPLPRRASRRSAASGGSAAGSAHGAPAAPPRLGPRKRRGSRRRRGC